MSSIATAPKTDQIEEERAGQCFARPARDDAELRRFAGAESRISDGGRLTLVQRLDSVWEGLLAAGAASCPVCSSRMERVAGQGSCGGCGSTLS